MSFTRALIIPDCHIPYEHTKAYQLMLHVAADFNPDEIVILGDFADFYAINSHGKHPKLLHTLDLEVKAVNDALDTFDKAFPDAKKIYIEGNHEFRLERYLAQKAPELFGITSIEHLFKLHARPNWRFVPYEPGQMHQVLGSKLYARHEPLGSTPKQSANKSANNVVYGHIHRIEEAHIVSLEGQNFVNFSTGWLGDKRKPIYQYVKGHHQWQMGFALVYVDETRSTFFHQTVQIHQQPDAVSCVAMHKRYKL